jgi:hypothetical protein
MMKVYNKEDNTISHSLAVVVDKISHSLVVVVVVVVVVFVLCHIYTVVFLEHVVCESLHQKSRGNSHPPAFRS